MIKPKDLKHKFSNPTKIERWGLGFRKSFCFLFSLKDKYSSNSHFFVDSSLAENFLFLSFEKNIKTLPQNYQGLRQSTSKNTHPHPWFTVDCKFLGNRIFFYALWAGSNFFPTIKIKLWLLLRHRLRFWSWQTMSRSVYSTFDRGFFFFWGGGQKKSINEKKFWTVTTSWP